MVFPIWITPVIVKIVWVVWYCERKFPATEQPIANVLLDWKLVASRIGMGQLVFPVTGACGIMIVNAMGGGWFHLRTDGWWFLLSVVAVILVTDFWGYLVHRAMHKFPIFWAMHSLHHSAETLTIITGARHFWVEDAIGTAVLPVLAIIFKIPPEVSLIVGALYLIPEGFVHANIRLSLGRFALVFNNPQYHRIHHSPHPEHFNKNFCRLLPLFDVIFGTALKPGKDEFPKTGLVDQKARGFLDGIIWPIRHRLSWLRPSSGSSVATGTGD
jgi:sterol desaturase/sphingolipid hydroxylase (fatty acid hydroxylase superfamily)